MNKIFTNFNPICTQVASFHGTGTKLNDINESSVTDAQLGHLGRTKGNPCAVVCQKWLTGHPKGAAAAWMINGALQMLATGIVPGNRNADNIDPALEAFEHLLCVVNVLEPASVLPSTLVVTFRERLHYVANRSMRS